MSVVPFRKREEPHTEGVAKCVGCQHQWDAVAPSDVRWLECPSCGLKRGTWYHPFGAAVGDLEFNCLCGSEALTAYQRRGKFWLRCMSCGMDQTAAIFGE